MAAPLEHTHKGVRYTCLGDGLLKDGHLYDAHPEKFYPPRNGTGSQIVEKKSASWWKAQCAFRGLNQTGAINDLQLRMREAKATMLPELKTAQTELNRQYKKSNKVTGSWANLKTVEQKAKADPERFLAEAFPKGATGRPANLDLVVVKLQDHPALADAAEALGLERVSVDAPWISGKKPSPDRWLIIGRHRDAVWNQMQEIQRETLRSKPTNPAIPALKPQAQKQNSLPKTKPTPTKLNAAQMQVGARSQSQLSMETSTPKPRAKRTARNSDTLGVSFNEERVPNMHVPESQLSLKPSPKRTKKLAGERLLSFPTSGAFFTNKNLIPSNNFQVEGLYKIVCPEIEYQWPPVTELSMNIIHSTIEGKNQLYAEFDFGIIKGFMRFEKPKLAIKTEPTSNKRKREQNIDDEEDMQMYERDASQYQDTVFDLGAKDMPNIRRPIWRYRWRGRETSETQIQLGSDKVVDTITFEKGGKISGFFKCVYGERCAFTGIQMETSESVYTGGPPYIQQSWENLGEETHSHEVKRSGSGKYQGFY